MENWLCTKTAAHKLGITTAALLALRRRGTIAGCKIGNAWLFRKDEIARILKDHSYNTRSRRTISLEELRARGQLHFASELKK